jgi:hypothetical protein
MLRTVGCSDCALVVRRVITCARHVLTAGVNARQREQSIKVIPARPRRISLVGAVPSSKAANV